MIEISLFSPHKHSITHAKCYGVPARSTLDTLLQKCPFLKFYFDVYPFVRLCKF